MVAHGEHDGGASTSVETYTSVDMFSMFGFAQGVVVSSCPLTLPVHFAKLAQMLQLLALV